MATISAHGGGCCGMRHIQGFRDGDGENVRQLARRTQPYADSRHQLEVILSDLQTRENPALLAALARLGYVYTSSWSGQHSTPVHLFLRAKYRLALESAHFYNRWVNDLNGMLPHPGLGGPLPRWTEPVRAAQQRWEVGTRVRCINPRSPNHGLPGTITRMADMGYAWSYGQVTYDHSGRTITYGALANTFELVQDEAPEGPPQLLQDYRHPDNPAGWPEPDERPTPAPEARRLILSQFYCVFRATGQASRVFATLQEGQEAYPQALDWHELKVYSNGDAFVGPVNHG